MLVHDYITEDADVKIVQPEFLSSGLLECWVQIRKMRPYFSVMSGSYLHLQVTIRMQVKCAASPSKHILILFPIQRSSNVSHCPCFSFNQEEKWSKVVPCLLTTRQWRDQNDLLWPLPATVPLVWITWWCPKGRNWLLYSSCAELVLQWSKLMQRSCDFAGPAEVTATLNVKP